MKNLTVQVYHQSTRNGSEKIHLEMLVIFMRKPTTLNQVKGKKQNYKKALTATYFF